MYVIQIIIVIKIIKIKWSFKNDFLILKFINTFVINAYILISIGIWITQLLKYLPAIFNFNYKLLS